MCELFFLFGPTAVGKSAAALEWACRHGAEILYCDAFCVYRGMDVGTAKPDAAERSRVPHHGLDLVEAWESFSVADYVAEARRVVEACFRRNVPLLVSGGSGFYLKSFFSPVLDRTPVPEAVRDLICSISREGGPEAVLKELERLNPDGVSGLDVRNPRRVQSALERCMASGKSLALLQREYREMPEPFPGVKNHLCLLMREREDLDRRIAARVRRMLACGLVDEVRRLRASGFERNPSAASAIGYREVLEALDAGCVDEAELAEAISLHTRQLVKKQCSFFRNQLPSAKVVNLEPGVEASELDLA